MRLSPGATVPRPGGPNRSSIIHFRFGTQKVPNVVLPSGMSDGSGGDGPHFLLDGGRRRRVYIRIVVDRHSARGYFALGIESNQDKRSYAGMTGVAWWR